MGEVFLHRSGRPDKKLGHVDNEGRIFRRDPKEEEIGRVDLGTGRVYITFLGQDTYAGRVHLHKGTVYRHVEKARDDYLGEVHKDGKMYRHRPAWPDKYVGNMTEPLTVAASGAAFLLLVTPAVEE